MTNPDDDIVQVKNKMDFVNMIDVFILATFGSVGQTRTLSKQHIQKKQKFTFAFMYLRYNRF